MSKTNNFGYQYSIFRNYFKSDKLNEIEFIFQECNINWKYCQSWIKVVTYRHPFSGVFHDNLCKRDQKGKRFWILMKWGGNGIS